MVIRVISVFAIVIVSAFSARAATFYVNTTVDLPDNAPGDGVCRLYPTTLCSLRAAIAEANYYPGADTISVPAGVYTLTMTGAGEDWNATGDLDIYWGYLTINGVGSGAIIQGATSTGAATDRVMQVWPSAGSVTLNNVTIRNGRLANSWEGGAGIHNGANLTVNYSTVRDNEIYQAQDIASQNGLGAGIYNFGGLTLYGSNVSYNKITRTTAGSHFDIGAGIANVNGTFVYLSYSNLTYNSINALTTPCAGGGIGFAAGPVNFSMTGGQISNNTLWSDSTLYGGGVYVRGGAGGASISLGYGLISYNRVNNGTSTSQGGGLYFERYSSGSAFNASLYQMTISYNFVNGSGGGISVFPYESPINLTLNSSTISSNSVYSNGGGINVYNPSSNPQATNNVTLTNCTVSGNSAYGNGGGIYAYRFLASAPSTVDLIYSTVALNYANNDGLGYESGGGIYTLNQNTRLTSSVVAGNFMNGAGTAPDISGTVYSYDYNHIQNLVGATVTGATAHNSTGYPALGPLANNGSYTLTHLPNGGSMLISKIPYGVNGCGTTYTSDQRGMGRPVEGLCDIGSVEWWQIN